MGRKTLAAILMLATCSVALLLPAQLGTAREGALRTSVPRARGCDRECLYRALDQYLAALAIKDPWRLPWASDARTSENNVVLLIGDGLWDTITALGDYQLRLADPTTGQVAFFGSVNESGALSPFAVRLQIQDGHIAQAETLVRRKADDAFMAEPTFVHKPVFDEVLPKGDRLPRERLISIADGYFDTLQLNDGTLFTQFDERCNRVENGVQTTNNPALAGLSFTLTLGCTEQFKLGFFRFDDRLRNRSYPLVDVERGLVLSSVFMDHAGRLGTYTLTDGRVVESRYRRPHTYYMLELFKITSQGRIRQIEAVFTSVPYHTPSSWTEE